MFKDKLYLKIPHLDYFCWFTKNYNCSKNILGNGIKLKKNRISIYILEKKTLYSNKTLIGTQFLVKLDATKLGIIFC